jgi:nicotinate dehydrogenase subunit A
MRFTLNGAAAEAGGEPNAPLLYLLRNDCGARGVRFGCGKGNCGACTVLIDGQPQQSCTTPNWSAADRQVTTTEGLASDRVGSVVLQAFLDEQAAQCGYCINGIMVSLTGLLKQHPAPTDASLMACLNRHLCRCGTHLRILRAARSAIAQLAAVA